jgi:hypothetical protein
MSLTVENFPSQEVAPQPVAERMPSPLQVAEQLHGELNYAISEDIQIAAPGEPADILAPLDLSAGEPSMGYKHSIRSNFINTKAQNLAGKTWWAGLSSDLAHRGLSVEAQQEATSLQRKHALELMVNGEPTGKGYEIFECGADEAVTEQELATAIKTVEMIDQLSGGALVESPSTRRLFLINGADIFSDDAKNKGLFGSTSQTGAFVNMRRVREAAQENGASTEEILAVTITHEMLGHQLEHATHVPGDRYFNKYFEYSDETQEGQLHKGVRMVTAKSAEGAGSQPVREYGSSAVAEDLATSVDALIADTYGWTNSTDKVKTLRSTPDSYRSELAMQLMDLAAAQAANTSAGNPGAVASPLFRNESGELVAARQFKHHAYEPGEAVAQEYNLLTEPYRTNRPFTVGPIVETSLSG